MFLIQRHTIHGLQICLAIFLQLTIAATSLVAAQTNVQLERIVTEIQQQLETQNSATFSPDLDWERLREFYVSNKYNPVWIDINGSLPKASVLRETLQNAAAEGLDPQTYGVETLDNIWPSRLPEKLAQLDLLLTNALLAYSVDVSYGRFDPQDIDPFWHIARPNMDAMALLRSIIANEDMSAALQALPPSQAGYKRLRDALASYRQIARNGGWSPLQAGPLLEFGTYHPEVAFLRYRLRMEGDLELRPVRDEELFDRAVKHAVERFQVRYGLNMDGIVGSDTRAVMNIPVTERIEKLKLNMERWRWLPRQLGQRYIMVNTAGFELAAFNNQQPQFTMWVIIGTPERQTPTLKGTLHTVVFNPYWTVPQTIAAEELIPKQQRDPDYFSQRGIRVYRNSEELDPREVNWSKVNKDHLPYVLRQDPGPRNPLGRIKFLFSNQHQIYLHDTPQQGLFNQTKRAFSHGCVRVEDPLRLANFVLGDDNAWDENEDNKWDVDKIKAMMEAEESVEVPVAERIPIYLVYWTAWVAEDGGVFFRPDIYERDPPNCADIGVKATKKGSSADIIQ
jgi:murein L,D-transpeptidase YcbB/YkuD